MRFADIPGNEDIKRALKAMADSGRVAHAMLLYENEGCGGLALALAYIRYLNCKSRHNGDSCGECPSCRKISKLIHPDLHFVFPVNSGSKIPASAKPVSESYLPYWRELVLANPYFTESRLYETLGMEGKAGNIAVAEAKYILEKLSLTSVEDGYKAVVIWLPERMNAETANRLLKIVEEPPEKTVFIFVTHSPEKVLQTIASRCQSFRVLPSSKEEVAETLEKKFGIGHDDALAAANIAGGSVGVALHGIEASEEYSDFLDMFSDLMQALFSKNLLGALETMEQVSAFKSKEKQKAFCFFMGECLRKIYMLQRNMDSIANLRPQEKEFFLTASERCGPSFCEKTLTRTDRAAMLIDRNVSARIVFCDLADRMFLSI